MDIYSDSDSDNTAPVGVRNKKVQQEARARKRSQGDEESVDASEVEEDQLESLEYSAEESASDEEESSADSEEPKTRKSRTSFSTSSDDSRKSKKSKVSSDDDSETPRKRKSKSSSDDSETPRKRKSKSSSDDSETPRKRKSKSSSDDDSEAPKKRKSKSKSKSSSDDSEEPKKRKSKSSSDDSEEPKKRKSKSKSKSSSDDSEEPKKKKLESQSSDTEEEAEPPIEIIRDFAHRLRDTVIFKDAKYQPIPIKNVTPDEKRKIMLSTEKRRMAAKNRRTAGLNDAPLESNLTGSKNTELEKKIKADLLGIDPEKVSVNMLKSYYRKLEPDKPVPNMTKKQFTEYFYKRLGISNYLEERIKAEIMGMKPTDLTKAILEGYYKKLEPDSEVPDFKVSQLKKIIFERLGIEIVK